MTMNRWKVLACTLTIGVGGLAVFATPPAGDKTEAPKEPLPLPKLVDKPETPPTAADTTAPKPAPAVELDLDIPVLPPTPTKAEEPVKKPASEPVFEPVAPPPSSPIIPVSGTDIKPPAKPEEKSPSIVAPPVPMKAPEPVKPAVPPIPDITPVSPPIDLDIPPAPPVAKPTTPVAPPKPEPVASPPPIDIKQVPDPVKPVTPIAPTKLESTSKLKMLLRMGDGRPRFEIRNTDTTELLLKVYGEKIEMQAQSEARSSLAGVTAIGRVRFTAPGIEGTCDHFTILSATGEVLLKGNIHLKTKHGKSWSEMTAEKMVYQIGTSGLASSPSSKPMVTPASYIPD